MREVKRYGIRCNNGKFEIVWIDVVRNGWWRGCRLPDGVPTRGPSVALLGRYKTEDGTKRAIAKQRW